MVGAKYISVLPLDKRIDIATRNCQIREGLFNKNFNNHDLEMGEIFDINLIKIIINALNQMPDYSIKISDVEKDIPFKIFFLKSFIHSYSYEVKGVKVFLELLMGMNYKEKYNEFNYMIRSLIDEAYFICQVYTMDLFCNQYVIQDNPYLMLEIQKNNSDPSFTLRDGIYIDKLINLFYSSKSYESEIHCSPDDFQIYFKKMFEIRKIYLRLAERDEEEEGKKEVFRFLKLMNDDNLFYFDIFNNDFTRKMISKSNEDYSPPNVDVIYEKNSEKIFDVEKNDLGFFENFIIEINTDKKIQEKMLADYMKKILVAYGLNKKYENEDEFLNEVFLHIRLINESLGTKEEIKNVIYLPKFLDENKNPFTLDLSSINLRIFEKELLYIFFLIFCCEYHKLPIFQNHLNDWNKLLLLFLCNPENVKYLLLDLKYLNFLFDIKVPIEDGNSRKSFLIRSLYNQNKNVKESNLTWQCFYYMYLYFIERYEDLQYLKNNILKYFVNEIINFYLIQYKKHSYVKDLLSTHENTFLDTMNYPLIYYFLRIVEKMLLRDNLNSFNPFSFNVNKFETLEKMNIIAEIVFNKRFNLEKFFSSFKFIENDEFISSKNPNQNSYFFNIAINGNISDNTILSGGDEMNGLIDHPESKDNKLNLVMSSHKPKKKEEEFHNANIIKKMNLQNIQFLILNILGNFYATYELGIFFKILNENLDIFVDFLKNKEKFLFHKGEKMNQLKPIIYRLELAILKFLLNFLKIKHYNYTKLEILNDIDLSERDMILFGFKAKNLPNVNLPDTIEPGKISLYEKYQIHKMRLNILDLLIDYISKFKPDFYNNENDKEETLNKDLASYLLNTLTLLLKDYFIKKNDGKILVHYEERFFGLLDSFYNNLHNFEIIVVDPNRESIENERKRNFKNKYHNESVHENEDHFNVEKNNDFRGKYKDFYEKFSKIPTKIMKNPRSLKEYEEELMNDNYSNFTIQITNKIKHLHSMFDGTAKKMQKYFQNFLLYDTRQHSMYSRLIRKILDKSKVNHKNENLYQHSRKKSKIKETYVDQVTSLDDINFIPFQSSKDNKLRDFGKYKELNSAFWMKVNEKFLNKSSKMEIEQLLDYMLSHLKILESKQHLINNVNFDFIFSESFIKTVNFFNNILYYRPVEVQRYLQKYLTKDQMIILLKNVLKLGNYIIGISEFENNEKLFASSKIYFIMMDFFILLTEGMYEGDTEDYFFINLKLNKEEKIEEVILLEKEIEDKCDTDKDKKNSLPQFFQFLKKKKSQQGQEKNKDDIEIDLKDENSNLELEKIEKVSRITGFFKPLIKKFIENSHISHKICKSLNPIDLMSKISITEEKKKEIGLNNMIIKIDELDDSTTLDDNYESLKNKILNLGEWTAKKIKKHVPEMINDFSYLFNVSKNLFEYSNFEDSGVVNTISEHYQYLFKISSLIFEQLLIYSKKIFNETYYLGSRAIKNIKDLPHSNITNKILLKNIVESVQDYLSFIESNTEKSQQRNMPENIKNHFEMVSKILERFDQFSNDFKRNLMDNSITENDINDFFCENHNEYIINMKSWFELIETDLISVIRDGDNENETKNSNDLLLTKGIDVREKQTIFFNPKMESLEIVNENLNQEVNNEENDEIIVYNSPGEIDEQDQNNKKVLEDDDYTDNFFYLNFLQLKRIMELINTFKYQNFNHGSERLILQFLYITRFLKEFLELDESQKNFNNRKIVTFCFNKIFDFHWIRSEKINNKDYSFIIRLGCLNLLNAYLEENNNDLDKEFSKKIFSDLHSYKNIFKEIVKCFEDANSETLSQNIDNSDVLFFNYIRDEESLYKTEYFELAESYYRLLRLIDPFYQDFLRRYSLEDKNESDQLYILKKNNQEKKGISSADFKKNYGLKDEIKLNEEFIFCKILEKEQFFKYSAQFLKRIGKEIQIKFENTNNSFIFRKIYFFKSPKCYWAPQSLKNTFFDTCQRKSLGTKLDSLNNNLDRFLLNISLCYKYRMIKSYVSSLSIAKIFKTFNPYIINSINFCCVFAVNILLLYYFFIDGNSMDSKELNTMMPLYKNNKIFYSKLDAIYICSIGLTFVQAILVTLWYIFRFNIRFSNIIFGENEVNNHYMIRKYRDEEDFISNSFNAFREMVKKYEDINHPLIKVKIFDVKSFFIILYFRLSAIMFNPEIFYLFWSFIFSITYLITNYKLLLVLQILSVINLYSLFSYFLTALINKSQQFIAILLFIYFIMYVFSWISFLHFQEFMIGEYIPRNGEKLESEGKKELLCSTAIECFLNYIDLGLRLGGGIGDSAARVSFKFDTTKNFIKKIVWDVVFHIIVNLIMANIFFGIIVDTFNELRDERELNEDDKKNKCFMCDLERFDNKAISEDFEVHRNVNHKVSNYIYVIPYLLNRNPQEYSRAEQYIWTQINLKKVDWFPSQIEEKK